MLRRLAKIPRSIILTSAAILLIFLAYEIWTRSLAGQIMADFRPDWDAESQDIVIVMPFEPEQFHMLKLQAAGRFISYENKEVTLFDVHPDDIRRLARNYWVSDIRLITR